MFDDASVLGGGDLLKDENADKDGQSDDARNELEQCREHEIVRGDSPEATADLKWYVEYFQIDCFCNFIRQPRFLQKLMSCDRKTDPESATMPSSTRELSERTSGAAHHLHLRQTVGGA